MTDDFLGSRDLLDEIIALVNAGRTFSDIHIEQDAPLMLKTPRGWAQVGAEPVTLEEMTPVLKAIDEDWEDKIIEHAIDRPVRTYSSGMTMRLGFAIAAFLEADVLLLDEVFAVGDESFQRKCFGVIAAFKERGGTILFVSHDASAVERLCDRAALLRDGTLAFDGPVPWSRSMPPSGPGSSTGSRR